MEMSFVFIREMTPPLLGVDKIIISRFADRFSKGNILKISRGETKILRDTGPVLRFLSSAKRKKCEDATRSEFALSVDKTVEL